VTRILLALLLAVAAAQAPGNPDHKEPPPGWFCSATGIGDHRCACKRMGDPMTSCEDVTEDAVCKVYCFKYACKCPIVCEMGKS
jgi:hypothetical protein